MVLHVTMSSILVVYTGIYSTCRACSTAVPYRCRIYAGRSTSTIHFSVSCTGTAVTGGGPLLVLYISVRRERGRALHGCASADVTTDDEGEQPGR